MNGYPGELGINGARYRIRTDYRDALACFCCINDPELSGTERALGVIGLLYIDRPPDLNEALRMAIRYLTRDRQGSGKADMDFELDLHYIRSSFRSDYGLDLNRAELHWWEFCELLQGLTDDCILNRVRDLRSLELSSVRDRKLRRRLWAAQLEVALPERLTREEKRLINEFDARLSNNTD